MRSALPTLVAVLALAPAALWADSSTRRPSLGGIELGMSYEDARSVLIARNMKPARPAGGGFNDRVKGLRAKTHFVNFPEGQGDPVPVAVTFPFSSKASGALEVTFVTDEDGWFVSAITTRKTYRKTYPEAFETIQNLKEDFGFRKSSCTSRGQFGFHSNVWNRKVVKMRNTNACLKGLSYDQISDWRQFFDAVGGAYNMDHGVTLKLSNSGAAPRGYVDKVETRLTDYTRSIEALEAKIEIGAGT